MKRHPHYFNIVYAYIEGDKINDICLTNDCTEARVAKITRAEGIPRRPKGFRELDNRLEWLRRVAPLRLKYLGLVKQSP